MCASPVCRIVCHSVSECGPHKKGSSSSSVSIQHTAQKSLARCVKERKRAKGHEELTEEEPKGYVLVQKSRAIQQRLLCVLLLLRSIFVKVVGLERGGETRKSVHNEKD